MTHEVEQMILTVGYVGLFAVVLFGSGLFGFFLPGSSLLFSAGLLASQGYFQISAVLLVLFLAAILGNSIGYALGATYGKRLFKTDSVFFLHEEHLVKTEQFYKEHGGKTIILARFFPVIRAFAPLVAGISSMKYSAFLLYNILGAILWAVGVPLLGFFVGETVPQAESFIFPGIGVIVLFLLISKLWKKLSLSKQKRE